MPAGSDVSSQVVIQLGKRRVTRELRRIDRRSPDQHVDSTAQRFLRDVAAIGDRPNDAWSRQPTKTYFEAECCRRR